MVDHQSSFQTQNRIKILCPENKDADDIFRTRV
jgi:hypothetical protein